MDWQDKMITAIESILNEGRECNKLYRVIIVDQFHVIVVCRGAVCLKRQTAYAISSHWIQECREIVRIIIESKIEDYLSKIKTPAKPGE